MENEEVICPLDANHCIKKSKLSWHVEKCRRNFKPESLEVCRYNSDHVFKKQDKKLKQHYLDCKDKVIYEKNQAKKVQQMVTDVKSLSISEQQQDEEEDWDLLPVYEVKLNTESKQVLRTIQNAPRAERKQFRQQERERLRNLEEKAGQTKQGSAIPGMQYK